jgi:hypothetical protein
VLHQVGVSFDLYYDARKHKIKIQAVSLHYVIQIKTNRNKDINIIKLATVRYFFFFFRVGKNFHCLLVII